MVDDIIEFRRHNSWPHFTVDRRTGAFNQHIPINIGARSLANTSTGRSFNADHCIQIEIVGNSVNSQSWSIAELNVIKGLIHQIETLIPILRKSNCQFFAPTQVDATSSNRMSVSEWNVFLCGYGHQHVPIPNNHRDPGAINISFLLSPQLFIINFLIRKTYNPIFSSNKDTSRQIYYIFTNTSSLFCSNPFLSKKRAL